MIGHDVTNFKCIYSFVRVEFHFLIPDPFAKIINLIFIGEIVPTT